MGGSMEYMRALTRNGLESGDYDPKEPLGLLRGDFRRLERDTQNPRHIAEYARVSGATEEQVRRLFRHFFGVQEPGCVDCQINMRRCVFHTYQVVADIKHSREYGDIV